MANSESSDPSTDESKENELKSKESECLLTDAGKYAFSGLAANILAELYNKTDEREFRHRLLDDLMVSIGLSEGARPSQRAVADGEYKTRPEPFIDLLLKEDQVRENPESLLTSLLLVAIKDGVYDARVRVVVEHMSWLLRVDMKSVEVVEERLLEILRSQTDISEEEKRRVAKKTRNTKIKRGFLIGLATVVGGTVIGLTGGLAAPLIATGVGAIIGTAGGAALGSVAGVAVIGSLFGVAGAGLTGYKMKKRVGGVEEFEFDVLTEGSQMTVTVAISGWVSKNGREDFRTPWLALDNSKEQYYLKYEGNYLQELGQSLDTISNLVVRQAIAESLKYTVLSTLMAAVAWPSTLLGLASIIDNPWHVCTKRAENTGKQLAEVLLSRQQGQRPVTLIGFSLGARVIFYCLRELAKHPQGSGIVENAYLLGAPVSGQPSEWQSFSKVVAGRIVNAYIRNDWLLKFLYRTASVQLRIAGISPVQWDDRRMINMDLTNVVNGHMDYMKKMPVVLEAVGIKTREVKSNMLVSHESSGRYSASLHSPAENNSSSQDSSPLLANGSSATGEFDQLPLLNVGEGESKGGKSDVTENPQQAASNLAYDKMANEELESNGSIESVGIAALPDKVVRAHLTQGEITDSDKSLTEKLIYEQLVEQGSSEDSVARLPLKHKLVKMLPVTKSTGSERLLGDISNKDRLLTDDSSDDSSLFGHTERLVLQRDIAGAPSSIQTAPHTQQITGDDSTTTHIPNSEPSSQIADLNSGS